MATSCLNELEDLITCPICLNEYDEKDETKKPKLLSCSHSVCFGCLKGMQKNSRDTCSLCRKKVVRWNVDDINLIPNNSYILCMMKMKALTMNPALDETGKRVPSMCMTCGSIGKTNCCQSFHSTLKMDSNTLSNFERLIALMDLATKMKAPIRYNLESIIQNQQKLQLFVNEVLKSLKSFELEIRALGQENQTMINKASSVVNQSSFMSDISKRDEGAISTFFSRFFSLANPNETDGESLESLSQKMKNNCDALQKQLNSFKSEPLFRLAEMINNNNDVIKSSVADSVSGTGKWMDWATSSTSTLIGLQKNLLQITDIISSVRQLKSNQEEAITKTANGLSEMTTTCTTKLQDTPLPPIAIALYYKGVINQRLEVSIFTSLGRFVAAQFENSLLSFGPAKALNSTGKPLMVFLPLIVKGPLSTSTFPRSSLQVKPSDVYLLKVKEEGSWAFLLVCDNLGPITSRMLEPDTEAFLFGRVVKGAGSLQAFCELNGTQRSNYDFKLCT